jgi:uncharacterized YigZ family protein
LSEIYLTIKDYAFFEIVEKRSRFVAEVFPVKNVNEIRKFLESVKKKYYGSKHNSYGYILKNENVMRYSDDGEPPGTAGVQILNVLKNFNLLDVVVIVTRYFGGALLGKKKLARVYFDAAKGVIDSSYIMEMNLCLKIIIECNYSTLNKIQNILKAFKSRNVTIEYLENVRIIFFVPVNQVNEFKVKILNTKILLTKIVFLEEVYIEK